MPYKDPAQQREAVRKWREANPEYHRKYNRRYYNAKTWRKYYPKPKADAHSI